MNKSLQDLISELTETWKREKKNGKNFTWDKLLEAGAAGDKLIFHMAKTGKLDLIPERVFEHEELYQDRNKRGENFLETATNWRNLGQIPIRFLTKDRLLDPNPISKTKLIYHILRQDLNLNHIPAKIFEDFELLTKLEDSQFGPPESVIELAAKTASQEEFKANISKNNLVKTYLTKPEIWETVVGQYPELAQEIIEAYQKRKKMGRIQAQTQTILPP